MFHFFLIIHHKLVDPDFEPRIRKVLSSNFIMKPDCISTIYNLWLR